MSHCGFKSLHPGLLPDKENRKCGIVRYYAEFLSIGNHSQKRKRTQGITEKESQPNAARVAPRDSAHMYPLSGILE